MCFKSNTSLADDYRASVALSTITERIRFTSAIPTEVKVGIKIRAVQGASSRMGIVTMPQESPAFSFFFRRNFAILCMSEGSCINHSVEYLHENPHAPVIMSNHVFLAIYIYIYICTYVNVN